MSANASEGARCGPFSSSHAFSRSSSPSRSHQKAGNENFLDALIATASVALGILVGTMVVLSASIIRTRVAARLAR
jgi:hypothetical protein